MTPQDRIESYNVDIVVLLKYTIQNLLICMVRHAEKVVKYVTQKWLG